MTSISASRVRLPNPEPGTPNPESRIPVPIPLPATCAASPESQYSTCNVRRHLALSASADPARLLALMAASPGLLDHRRDGGAAACVPAAGAGGGRRRTLAVADAPARPVEQSAPAPTRQPAGAGPQAGNSPVAGAVRAWEGRSRSPPTKRPAGPQPALRPLLVGRFNYPYTLRDGLTTARGRRAGARSISRTSTSRCTVLPDLGGHLYSCSRQGTGSEMFYANTRDQERASRVPRRLGGARDRVQLPRVAQLGDRLAGGLRDRAQTPTERLDLGRQHGRVYGCQWRVELTLQAAASASSSTDVRSTTRAPCATASTGGPTPPCA